MFKRSDVFQNCNIFKPLLDNNNYKIITFLCLITIIPNTQQDLEDLKRVGLELGIITKHNTYNTNSVIRHVLCIIITYSKNDSAFLLRVNVDWQYIFIFKVQITMLKV